MNSERCDKKLEFLKNQVKFIKESGFDSVRIFASFHDIEKENTITWDVGRGNWYMQYGQIREWLLMSDQQAIEKARRDPRSGND